MSDFLPLVAGDQIALVCTGSVCDSKADPLSCVNYLADTYQLQASFDCDTYLVLPALVRAQIFLRYLQAPEIKAIWSVRGGEGSADLIPYLEAQAQHIKKIPPKLLFGFSDFTAILIYFAQRFGWPVMHSLGARQLPRRWVDHQSEKSLMNWLFAKQTSLTLENLKPLNQAAFAPRQLVGEVIGGNLSLIHISLKDSWELKPENKILLIEEVNEKPYQVLRMLKHLERIGFFTRVKAVIFAGCNFPDLGEREASQLHQSMQTALMTFARELGAPVLYTGLIGHGTKNFPVPFYKTATLMLGDQAKLEF